METTARTTDHAPAVAGGGAFHTQLEEQNRALWSAILDLPFVREVGAGTLALDRFAFFIGQDLLYLDQFASVLSLGAARAEDGATKQLFLRHAQTVFAVETALHETLAPQLRLDPQALREREPAPVTLAYTDHLQKVARGGSLAEIAAAVLPCYWVYRRVGDMLSQRAIPHPVYAQWVASYASPTFGEAVDEQLRLVDALAAAASPGDRERMARWHRRSLRYEWMFWDQAYRLLEWPVA